MKYETMNLKETKEGYVGDLGRGKGRDKLCYYIIISKIEEKNFKLN